MSELPDLRTDSGARARRTTDTKGDGFEYKNWHRTLRADMYALDVDLIEWRDIGGETLAVALTEVTCMRRDVAETESEVRRGRYLAKIIEAYNFDRRQGHASRTVAASLNIYAYVICYHPDCTRFWVFNLTTNRGWWSFTPQALEKFLWQCRPIGA